MNDNDNKVREKKLKLIVLLAGQSNLSVKDIERLFFEAGFDDEMVEILNPEIDDIRDLNFFECSALLIPLEEDFAEDEKISECLVQAVKNACPIVGIWGPDEVHNAIHPMVSVLGSAQIPWDSQRLAAVIAEKCPRKFETPEGTASTVQEIRINRCR